MNYPVKVLEVFLLHHIEEVKDRGIATMEACADVRDPAVAVYTIPGIFHQLTRKTPEPVSESLRQSCAKAFFVFCCDLTEAGDNVYLLFAVG
jgi:hypothetical protein